MNSFSINNKLTRKTTVSVKAQNRVIRLCKDCIHYNEKTDSCKALSLINYKNQSVESIKSLICRTREDLCGMDARYYEPNYMSLKTEFVGVSKLNDDINYEHWTVSYNPDGSAGICGEGCDIELYYNNIHLDYIDVY